MTDRSGEARTSLRRVGDLEACTADGGYFDDPVSPTHALYSGVRADARMDVALGCFPILGYGPVGGLMAGIGITELVLIAGICTLTAVPFVGLAVFLLVRKRGGR